MRYLSEYQFFKFNLDLFKNVFKNQYFFFYRIQILVLFFLKLKFPQMKKLNFLSMLIISIAFFISCSNDDESNNNNLAGEDVSQEMTFEISGVVNGVKNGQARVLYVNSGNSNNRFLTGNDGPAITGPEQTFSIDFSTLNVNGEVPQFTEGTYELSENHIADPNKYTVSYSVIDENFNEVNFFGGYLEHSGTLNVTSVSGNRIQGTFNFTAANATGETITVSNGQFNARILD